jgi:hypothetical protein
LGKEQEKDLSQRRKGRGAEDAEKRGRGGRDEEKKQEKKQEKKAA